MNIPLSTFADRAWYAYQCLPRGKNGKLPSLLKVMGPEKRLLLARLFNGERSDPRQETRAIIAEALKVPRAWLDLGEGEPPKLTGPYKAMPRDQKMREQDPGEWIKKYEAIGGIPTATPNNFQIAVLCFGSILDSKTIEAVAIEARNRENSEEPLYWAERLRLAQIRLTGGAGFRLELPKDALQASASLASNEKAHAKKAHAG